MLRFSLIIFVLLVTISSLLAGSYHSTNFILGHEAEQHQFPWQVSVNIHLNNGNSQLCGGTLISDEWILTAASCLSNDTKEIIIGLGSNELRSPAVVMRAVNLTIHPDFKEVENDFARNNLVLVKMNGTIIFTDWIEPILLPGEDQTGLSFEGVKGKISGWGTVLIEVPIIENQQPIANNILNWHDLTVISNKECLTSYSKIDDSLLCTRVVSGGNVCGCDIGGALVILDPEGWKLIGISSYTPGCDSLNPAIFSRITSYLHWISENTGIEINLY